jgi:hypothetical protein
MFLITVGSLEHRRRAARINKPWWSGERDPTAVAVFLETVSPESASRDGRRGAGGVCHSVTRWGCRIVACDVRDAERRQRHTQSFVTTACDVMTAPRSSTPRITLATNARLALPLPGHPGPRFTSARKPKTTARKPHTALRTSPLNPRSATHPSSRPVARFRASAAPSARRRRAPRPSAARAPGG